MLSTERGDNLAQTTPKQIAFELLLDDESKTRARIPLRILVHPQDVTDSIVATVKAFYGIYEGHGVSFEDVRGNSLVANYNNLVDGMTVNVRTVPGPVHPFLAAQQSHYQHVTSSDAQRRASLGDPFQMLPPHLHEVSRSPSRPSSRLARKRSTSPQVQRGRRSASHQKARSVSAASRGSSANGTYQEDNFNSYSDSEEGRSSVAGSRKARSEQYASAEISSENILQDGRRNKILFESSVCRLMSSMSAETDLPCRNFHSSSLRRYLSLPLRPPFRHSDALSDKKVNLKHIRLHSSYMATRVIIHCHHTTTIPMDMHWDPLHNTTRPYQHLQIRHMDTACATDRTYGPQLRHLASELATQGIGYYPLLIPLWRVAYLMRMSQDN